jgi:hypothetical protein
MFWASPVFSGLSRLPTLAASEFQHAYGIDLLKIALKIIRPANNTDSPLKL